MHNMRYQTMEEREYSPAVTDLKSETIDCPQLPQTSGKKKNSIKNNRRFSDEQIRSLESIFQSETKLEPRKKLQLARELGLQPRQVAIWFQNKRARWKSKQIEHEYNTLRANYDNLATRFESLKNERQSLLIQLQNLSELLGEQYEGNRSCKGMEGSIVGIACENTNCEPEEQQRLDKRVFACSEIDKGRDIGPSQNEGCKLLNNASLASPEKWYSSDSGGQLDMLCGSSQWFNFWT